MQWFACGVLATLLCGHTDARSLEVREETITISGRLTNALVDEVEALIRDDPQPVRSIIFKHCLGGQAGPAQRLTRLIKQRWINTVASMQVSSACAMAFLAGETRSLDPASDIVLIALHNASDANGTPTSTPEFVTDRIRALTQRRFPPELLEVIRTSYGNDSGLMIAIRHKADGPRETGFFACPPGSRGQAEQCRRLSNYDLHEIGVLKDR